MTYGNISDAAEYVYAAMGVILSLLASATLFAVFFGVACILFRVIF